MLTSYQHALISQTSPSCLCYPPIPDDDPPVYTIMAAQTTNMPIRSASGHNGEAIPDGDPSETTGLLLERLQAYKHMCGYLEDYINEVAKDEKSSAKEKEKILKAVSNPLKEGHHFDQNIGGIAGLFENIRANTQAQSNMHAETSKSLTGTVLPILERLHAEIKNKNKELNSGAAKGSKAVDKARNTSQKHIELLGQHTGTFDSTGGRVDAANDPYVLHRGIRHRLNKQILEENNNRQDLLTVQGSFQQFEAHIITTIQAALNSFNQFMGSQADCQKALYGDVAATAQNIPLDFEWTRFVARNDSVLINPNSPVRSMINVTFPNMNHRAAKPLVEGSLERKSRALGALKGYSAGYYAVTPAGYIHEFKDDDDFRKDPTPEVSLYLPDCTVGAVDGTEFAIKGKDMSSGKLGSKLAGTSDFKFKAHSPADAQTWHSIIVQQAGRATGSAPVSPVESQATSGNQQQPGQINTIPVAQQQGVFSGEKMASPTSAGGVGHQRQGIIGGGAGVVPQQSTAGEKMTSPTSAGGTTGQGSHFHGAPATAELGERKYVA